VPNLTFGGCLHCLRMAGFVLVSGMTTSSDQQVPKASPCWLMVVLHLNFFCAGESRFFSHVTKQTLGWRLFFCLL